MTALVDARADQYALAATCHEMLTGAPPFTGASSHDLIVRRFTTPVAQACGLRGRRYRPRSWEALQRALALKPADRFATIADFGAALGGGRLHHRSRRGRRAGRSAAHGAGGAGPSASWRWSERGLVYSRSTDTARGRGRRGTRAPSRATRLAVLPFENLGDSADAYFADGIADEVRGKLAVLSGLEVIARSSSSRYRGDGEVTRGHRAGPGREVPADRHRALGEAAGTGHRACG